MKMMQSMVAVVAACGAIIAQAETGASPTGAVAAPRNLGVGPSNVIVTNGCTFAYDVDGDVGLVVHCISTETGVVRIPESIDGIPVHRFDGFQDVSVVKEVHFPLTVDIIVPDAFNNFAGMCDLHFEGAPPVDFSWIGAFSEGCTAQFFWRAVHDELWRHRLAECGLQGIVGSREYEWRYSITTMSGVRCAVINRIIPAPVGAVVVPSYIDGLEVGGINTHAFSNQTGVVSISMPPTVKQIAQNAFAGCENLAELAVTATQLRFLANQYYSQGHVRGCSNLFSVVVRSGDDQSVFLSLMNSDTLGWVRELTLPSYPSNIPYNAQAGFSHLPELEILNFPANVTLSNAEGGFFLRASNSYLRSNANPNLKAVNIESGGALFSSEDGVVFNADKTTLYFYPPMKEGSEYVVPDTVTNIANFAFFGNKNLESVTLPMALKRIGTYAFSGCERLLEFKGDVEPPLSIRDGVLYQSSQLMYWPGGRVPVELPETYTILGPYAFSYMKSLTSLRLPDRVRFSLASTLIGCWNLETIEAVGSNVWAHIENDIVVDGSGRVIVVPPGKREIIVPNGAVEIADSAFRCCTNLESVLLPEGLTGIGAYAFQDCSSLEAIDFPASTMVIGAHAFDGCSMLSGLSLNDGLVSIGSYAFRECHSLSDVAIPTSVTNLGQYAFYNATGLANFSFPPFVGVVPASVLENAAVEEIVVPEGVWKIDSRAFYGCENLKKIIIPEGVSSIGQSAFYRCGCLADVELPSTVSSLGSMVFGYSGVRRVLFKGRPPTFQGGFKAEFSNVPYVRVVYPDEYASQWASIVSDCAGAKNIEIFSVSEVAVPYVWVGADNAFFGETNNWRQIDSPDAVPGFAPASYDSISNSGSIAVNLGGNSHVVNKLLGATCRLEVANGTLSFNVMDGGMDATLVAGEGGRIAARHDEATWLSVVGGSCAFSNGRWTANADSSVEIAVDADSNLRAAITLKSGSQTTFAVAGGCSLDISGITAEPGARIVKTGGGKLVIGELPKGVTVEVAEGDIGFATEAQAVGADIAFAPGAWISFVADANGVFPKIRIEGVVAYSGEGALPIHVFNAIGEVGTCCDVFELGEGGTLPALEVVSEDDVRIVPSGDSGYALEYYEAAISVTNVACRQRYPWNGLVDIDFEIVSENPHKRFSVEVSAKEVSTGTSLSVAALTPEDKSVSADDIMRGQYRFVWDAAADLGDSGSSGEVLYTIAVAYRKNGGSSTCAESVVARALDLSEETRIASDAEKICYSPRWGGAEGCTVSVNANEVVAAAEEGEVEWTPPQEPGVYVLTHTAGDLVYDARFVVLGEGVSVHGGAVVSNEVWGADSVHLVTGMVSVVSGGTLMIEPGAVVKFMDGTGIAVAIGGTCTAKGVTFTHVNDDTVGGDTLFDGASVPQSDKYTVEGVTDDAGTDYRYLAPVVVSGRISQSQTWRGRQVYRVSGYAQIVSGATVTIRPGAIVKFEQGAQLTVCSGATLDAIGTRAQPIVFTSIRDDEHGGDTNKDGTKTMPNGGDWRYIYVQGVADLDHCKLLYGAPNNETGIIETSGTGRLAIDNSFVAHAKYDGIWNWDGEITVRNTVITDVGLGAAPYRGSKNEYVNCVFFECNYGLMYWGGWSGRPKFTNCVFANMGMGWTDTNSSSLQFRPGCEFRNCLFWNPADFKLQSASVVGSNGNIWGDPLFADGEGYDFRVKEGSPCVDAGDSSAAPESDCYGQPRMGAAADIGIHEFLLRGTVSDVDLVARSVTLGGGKTAAPGDSVLVKWTVGNVGGSEAQGVWSDSLSLVSDTGRSIALGDFAGEGYIAADGALGRSMYVTVPAVSEGVWRLRVNVNSSRDIFEGTLTDNNTSTSEDELTVAIPATDVSSATGGQILPGVAKVLKLSFAAEDENRMVKLGVPTGVKVTWGFGFMPQGASKSGAATATGDGAMFRVPDDATEVYLLLESDSVTTYNLSTETTKMTITGVSPSTLPSSGTTTLTITGAGFGKTNEVSLVGAAGRVVLNAPQQDASGNLIVTVDCDALVAGNVYDVKVLSGENEVVMGDAVRIEGEKGYWKIAASLVVPSSMRAGRESFGYVEYENHGNLPAPLPVFSLGGDGGVLLKPAYWRSSWDRKLVLLAAPEPDCRYVAPRRTYRMPFLLKSINGGDVRLSLSIVGGEGKIDIEKVVSGLNLGTVNALEYDVLREIYGSNWGDFAICMAQYENSYPIGYYCSGDVHAMIHDRINRLRYASGCVAGRIEYAEEGVEFVGEKVYLVRATENDYGEVLDSVTVDERGAYIFMNVTNGNYRIMMPTKNIDSNAFFPVNNDLVVRNITIERNPTTVVNAENVDPALRSKVQMRFLEATTGEQIVESLNGNAVVGLSSFGGGDWSARAIYNGVEVGYATNICLEMNRYLTLPKIEHAVISGTVVDSDGVGIYGCQIAINDTSLPVSSDVDGVFNADIVVPMSINLTVKKEGYLNFSTNMVACDDIELGAIKLVNTVHLVGRLLNAGVPMLLGFYNVTSGAVYYALSDEAGCYGIDVPVGTYSVAVGESRVVESIEVTHDIKLDDIYLADDADNPKAIASGLKSSNLKSGEDSTATLLALDTRLRALYAVMIGHVFGLSISAAAFGGNYLGPQGNNKTWGYVPYHSRPNDPWVVTGSPDEWMVSKAVRPYSSVRKTIEDCVKLNYTNLRKGYKLPICIKLDYNMPDSSTFDKYASWRLLAFAGLGQATIKVTNDVVPVRLGNRTHYSVGLVTMSPDTYDFTPGQKVTDFFGTFEPYRLEVAGWATKFYTRLDIYDTFEFDIEEEDGGEEGDEEDQRNITVPVSQDPNEMAGPIGFGDPETERFVKPGEWMTYTIYFENMSNATAAAQEVYVSQAMSANLDWSTFEMSEVAFGDQIDIGLAGKKSGSCDATMTGTNLIVRTSLALDETTGLATWYMRIVDPTTDTGWPKDILSGFLPPNDPETHCGEGHITYRVKVRDNAAAGARIDSAATIVFDYNDPIVTDPAWWNNVAIYHTPTLDLGDDGTTNLLLIAGQPFGELPTPPTRKNWKFDGWYTGENGTGIKATPDAIVPDGDFELYQNWLADGGVAKFADCDVLTDEGSNAVVRVYGGNNGSAASVKVYLTYNTAAAADVDLKTAAVDSSTGGSPVQNAQAARSTNLKFPLTLTWEKGEIGEKVITISVKADKAVEGDEFFTLQLADAVGMELGEERVCAVTVHDPGYDELAAKVAADTASKAEKTAWGKLQKAKAPYIRGLADSAERGKVSGSGLCAAGKKVTLKASANKNFVFVGWCQGTGNGEWGTGMPGFDERLQKGAVEYVATTPSLVIDRSVKPAKDTATSPTITNVNEDATFYACFITTAEDKAAIAASVDGLALDPWVSKTETHAFATNIWAGVYLEWPVAASALSATTIKVAGLPAGLKFAAKPVTAKVGSGKAAVVVTNVQANTIYGAPTAASKIDKKTNAAKPSEVKVTVTTAGKSSQTYQIDTVVDALPSWAQGTYSGGGHAGRVTLPAGQVSLTVSSAGKISGKALGGGLTYTLAAPYYSGFALEDDGEGVYSNFLADVTASWSYKEGSKTIKTNDVVLLTVQDNGIGGVAAVEDWFEAYTVNWKIDPWKTLGKKFDKKTIAYTILSGGSIIDGDEAATTALGEEVTGRVMLKFTASGSVSVSGEFVSGAYNDKTKKYPTVKATGSATLVPVDSERFEVFIYLTPKGLPPHARCLDMER